MSMVMLSAVHAGCYILNCYAWVSTMLIVTFFTVMLSVVRLNMKVPNTAAYTRGSCDHMVSIATSSQHQFLKVHLHMLGKVAGVKVYPRQTWNFRSHAVSACIGLWCHSRCMNLTGLCMHLIGLCMHVVHALCHDITGQCMQLLHGLCCFDFVSDIPLSPATLYVR